MRISDDATNEELIKFAKDQCEIFPEDSYMGKYLRETIKMLEERALEQSSNDIMGNSVGLLYDLRDKCCSFEEAEYYKALSLAIQSIILDKIKQTREEIDTDVRTTVKHFTNTDAIIDYVLDSIDELIEEEEE
jgi:hypothetical protein